MIREDLISREAIKYAEKNITVSRNLLPSVNTMTSFINGAKWADKTMIDKACKWLNKSTILADTTIDRFRQAMEE